MKMICDPHLKKIVKYANELKIVPDGEIFNGIVEIRKIRKYPSLYYDFSCEVDIVFKGKINCILAYKIDWFGPEILKSDITSKIRVNRLFRSQLSSCVRNRLKIFMGSDLDISIKNVKWE